MRVRRISIGAAPAWILALFIAGPAEIAPAQQVIVDNLDAGYQELFGDWTSGSFPTPWGPDYRFALTEASTTALAEWRPSLPQAGDYLVEVWYVSGANRANNAPFTIHHAGGDTTVPVNQETNGSQWNALGAFAFNAGTAGSVTLDNGADPSVVIADAVRFTLQEQEPGEFRGMWVSRFEWPSSNRTNVENKITYVMDNLQAFNFNAVLFQVRGQADTLYPSPYEPWSPLVSSNGGTPAGWGSFDPLAFAINAAHSRGLEFHAYINTHTCWQNGDALPPNYNLNHVFWDHCNAADPGARDWLVHDETGTPVQFEESDYVWIAPGVPAAQAYSRRQIMHVVQNYDVDGVHFDRIRSPGTEYSHDPISEARRFGAGNPAGLGFEDWTRDQFTRMLRDVYAQIMEVKPWVKVSSAPLGLYRGDRYPGYPTSPCGYFYGYSCVYQDAQAWLAAGAQDFIVPQIYWADGGGNPDFSEILPDWIANDAGRHVYAGQITSVGVSALLSQIGVTRSQGAEGNVVFSHDSFDNNDYWFDYTGPGDVYDEPVAVPDMPWKSSPTKGIIIGTVTDVDGTTPIVDCGITRTGSTYTALSSGDGLYSFLLVDPGAYTLTYTYDQFTWAIGNVQVAAGQVTRVDTPLGGPGLPGDYDGDGDVDLEDHEVFATCMQGPTVRFPLGHVCLNGDTDDDRDVDLLDFSIIQPLYAE